MDIIMDLLAEIAGETLPPGIEDLLADEIAGETLPPGIKNLTSPPDGLLPPPGLLGEVSPKDVAVVVAGLGLGVGVVYTAERIIEKMGEKKWIRVNISKLFRHRSRQHSDVARIEQN